MRRRGLAEQIRALNDGKRTRREIAQAVNTDTSYVNDVLSRDGRSASGRPTMGSNSSFIEPWTEYRARRVAERKAKKMEGGSA